ncbi:hypothetical protein BJX68DRAFT_48712 [Aspergillus pseudodeflectus]|uniref:gamma-glutamylcyclotransferase n=1 Tax=Aspergillus pseudodeflectus TaxID=176178 RepID=A0ABR4KL49_9EURO
MHRAQSEDSWPEEVLEAPTMSMSQSFTLEQLREDLIPPSYSDFSTARELPQTTPSRQRASISTQSLDQDEYLPGKLSHVSQEELPEKTVLYLAYGSNLASKTFLGMRGIKPLSQISVLVPELRLTFDLPGLPYMEPCFAGTHFRKPHATEADHTFDDPSISEKDALLDGQHQKCDQGRYKGPLIGVVYEVTLSDYAKIIATEGGGRGYKDIVVTCYPFPSSYDPHDPVPERPETQPMKAHTLLSPAGMEELRQLQTGSDPHVRPNPRHAQPSARYLNLITTGAEEHNLPLVYREYLSQIQPYRITSLRQKVGKGVFVAIWGPMLLLTLALSRIFAGPDGRSPGWVVWFADSVLSSMWWCYDHVMRPLFGDGERTIERLGS